ncbi:MAG: hypothetical protein HKN09_10390 [Saprospiraceae bacterium]|nr:hypothetical protein [Saprospiraceae bacterium]
MEEKDKLIKDIILKAGRAEAPEYLHAQVIQKLEAERQDVLVTEPLLPRWVWPLMAVVIATGFIYLNYNSIPDTSPWSSLINSMQFPQIDISFSIESKLLNQISKYALFLIPALLLQFLYIHYFINGFKGIGVKK